MAPTDFDKWMQGITFVSVALVAVFSSGMVQRLLILVGLIVASVVYAVLTNSPGPGQAARPLPGIANAAHGSACPTSAHPSSAPTPCC